MKFRKMVVHWDSYHKPDGTLKPEYNLSFHEFLAPEKKENVTF